MNKTIYVIFALLIWTNLAWGNWELPTSVQQDGNTTEFCVEGVTSNDSYKLFLDDVDVTVEFADLLNVGDAAIYDYPDEMCLRVNKLEFITSKTLSLWLDDNVGTWELAVDVGTEDSEFGVDLESQSLTLREAVAVLPKPGDTCTINRTAPVLPCPGCPTALCGTWIDAPNPFPCCDNNVDNTSRGYRDGKCEWWAARSARLAWGFYPYWGEAKNWRAKADLDIRVVRDFFRPGRAGLYLDPTRAHVAWATGLTNATDGSIEIKEMNCGRARYTGTWKINDAGELQCTLPWSKIEPIGDSSGFITRWIVPVSKDFVYKNTQNHQCATGVWTDVKGLIWNLYQNNQTITGTTDAAGCGLYKVTGSLVGDNLKLLAVPAKIMEGCCNSSFEGTMVDCVKATVHFTNYCTGNHGDMQMTKRGL